jgi:hypothetical protein
MRLIANVVIENKKTIENWELRIENWELRIENWELRIEEYAIISVALI